MLLEITTLIGVTTIIYQQLPEGTKAKISQGAETLAGTCCNGSNGCLGAIFSAGISLIQESAEDHVNNFNEASTQTETSLSGVIVSQPTE